MWIYIFIFLIVCLLNFLYRSSGGIPKPVFAAIMLFLALFVGLGDMLGVIRFFPPYNIFLSDGVREGDYIHAKYEYCNRYDYNKFYR